MLSWLYQHILGFIFQGSNIIHILKSDSRIYMPKNAQDLGVTFYVKALFKRGPMKVFNLRFKLDEDSNIDSIVIHNCVVALDGVQLTNVIVSSSQILTTGGSIIERILQADRTAGKYFLGVPVEQHSGGLVLIVSGECTLDSLCGDKVTICAVPGDHTSKIYLDNVQVDNLELKRLKVLSGNFNNVKSIDTTGTSFDVKNTIGAVRACSSTDEIKAYILGKCSQTGKIEYFSAYIPASNVVKCTGASGTAWAYGIMTQFPEDKNYYLLDAPSYNFQPGKTLELKRSIRFYLSTEAAANEIAFLGE